MIESIGAVGPATPSLPSLPPPAQAPQPRAERPPEHVVATTVAAMVAPPQLARRPESIASPPSVRPVDLATSARAVRLASADSRQDARGDAASRADAEAAYARTLREALLLAVAADR